VAATEPSQPPPLPDSRGDRRFLWIMVAVVCTVNLAIFLHSCRTVPGDTLKKAGEALAGVAAAFTRGTITTEFRSYATTVTNQQLFQFATLRQQEVFTRAEEMTTGFGYIPLPEVVVEARAPVEYTPHLDFNGPWKFALRDRVLHVFPPPIRFNKPAIDVSQITYEVRKGMLRTDEALENLKKSLSSLAVLKAKDNIPLVRENCRQQTVLFVERWLAKSFGDGKEFAVKVHFAGERLPEGVTTPEAVAP
jgi:hypothetical protein